MALRTRYPDWGARKLQMLLRQGGGESEGLVRLKSTRSKVNVSTLVAKNSTGMGHRPIRLTLLRRFRQQPLEESLLGRGLPQCIVAIHVRRQPTLESFGFEDGAMNRVVVAHG